MIDIHTHILPEMDDGSRSVEESLTMLSCYSDHFTDICLTPHFYPYNEDPESFLARREESFQKLKEALGDTKTPRLHLGAEVAYFEGIGHCAAAEDLKIEGTRLLLVEMPFKPWTRRMMDELLTLNRGMGVRPVLAHLDRYDFGGGANRDALSYFLTNRGLAQVNTEAFKGFFSRKKAISMIRGGAIHLIGSDAHRSDTRKPDGDEILTLLSKSGTEDVLSLLQEREERYF